MEPITMNRPTRRASVHANAPPAATFRPDDANTWVPALRYDHTQPMHSVALQILHTAGLPHTGPFQGVWAVTIQQKELMRVVAELLSDSFICGYTSEAITHPARTDFYRAVFLPYLVSLLHIAVIGLEFLRGRCDHSEHPAPRDARPCPTCTSMSTLLTPFGSGYGSFLRSLWEIADPFLRQEDETIPAGLMFGFNLGDALRQSSLLFARIIINLPNTALRKHLTEKIYFGAHLMMFLWLSARNRDSSRGASTILLPMLTLIFHDFETRPYSKFFREIVDCGITPREIRAAILADMVEDVDARGSMPGDSYGTAVAYASQFRLEGTISLNCHTEHALLWYSLSAGRRELCSAMIGLEVTEQEKLHHESKCVTKLCSYLCKIFGREEARSADQPPYVPELWIYAVLIMFARHFFNHIQFLNMTVRTDKVTLIPALRELSRSLRYYRVHPSPPHSQPWRRRPPPSLRMFAMDWWKQAQIQLQKLPREADPLLRVASRTCVNLYRDLDNHHKSMLPGEVEGVQDFEPLERCAWDECTCSVFQPLHRLKKCARCHLVAYCNSRCQRENWKDHKSTCKSARGGK